MVKCCVLLEILYQYTFATLIVAIPALVVPFVMRFALSHLILFIVKRRYLPGYLELSKEGWQEERDLQVVSMVCDLVLKRLKAHFVMRYDFKEDAKAILLCLQNTYKPGKNQTTISYKFSITKLLECLMLAFGDLYRQHGSSLWFRIVKNTRVIWFSRMMTLQSYYERALQKLGLVRALQSTRLLVKIFRIALLPLIGVPSLIWYGVRSLLLSVFLEGFLRFLYGITLLKIGYYGMYLYGRDNAAIRARIKDLTGDSLAGINSRVEHCLLNVNSAQTSPCFQEALRVYLKLLEEFGLRPDSKLAGNDGVATEAPRGFWSRFWQTTKEAYRRQNPLHKAGPSDKENLERLYSEISRVYYPRAETPLLRLRVKEIIEVGYMASAIILHKIFATPGVSTLLDTVSLDFALRVKSLAEGTLVVDAVKKLGLSYRYLRFFRRGWKVVNLARKVTLKVAASASLVWTLSSPIAFQQLRTILREYIYYRAGRLLLYAWEMNKLKRKEELADLIW